jgi:hypothetical protein
LFEEQSILFKLSEKLKELNLNDSDIREWANKITEISVNNYSIDITHDFMLFICRLLDLKQSDILYESYACDEKFLYEANKAVKEKSLDVMSETMRNFDVFLGNYRGVNDGQFTR